MHLRKRQNPIGLAVISLAVVLVVLGLLTWANFSYATTSPGGNDFLVHWVGTRSFLVDGLSPYSDATALRIQTAAYGQAAQPGQHELRVAYPFYSIILFFPFALFQDPTLARALWMTTLETALILMAIMCIRLVEWRPNLVSLVFYLLFAMMWYHAVRPLINGNAVILVALGLVGGMLAVRSRLDELAGVLFAFTTIKPQVVVVFILFVIFWSLANRRWRLLAWLFGTMVVLVSAGAFLLPDWILQNLREIARYPGYNPPGTPGAALATWFPAMGERLGLGITGIMMGLILFEWIVGRNAGFRGFVWMAGLTLTASQWIGIQTDPGNFIVCFPGLVLCFALLEERWRKGGWIVSSILMLLIGVGLWVLFIATLELKDQPIQSPIMFFPLPILLFILLYWTRWSAFNAHRPWFDLINQEHRKL
jgi:hypothetical protein